ncbi:hypothetical protein BRD09_00060 [Halobacteriales archaeon SW_10_68_16]|jgi:hypothetical protein|nr:MAG: hypothetical protein BRD09_00060 [Halobacteriales archaeon SW_10_68_16]
MTDPGETDRPADTEEFARKFEAKYEHYFPELQQAYRQAFETMNDAYDSELIHAIDQQILAESEPLYEGDGQFRVELPEEPVGKLGGVVVADEKAEAVLERYVGEIETELRGVFGFE